MAVAVLQDYFNAIYHPYLLCRTMKSVGPKLFPLFLFYDFVIGSVSLTDSDTAIVTRQNATASYQVDAAVKRRPKPTSERVSTK